MDEKRSITRLNPPFIIKSDGTPAGTEISDDFGNQIGKVTKISWGISMEEAGKAEIHIVIIDDENENY